MLSSSLSSVDTISAMPTVLTGTTHPQSRHLSIQSPLVLLCLLVALHQHFVLFSDATNGPPLRDDGSGNGNVNFRRNQDRRSPSSTSHGWTALPPLQVPNDDCMPTVPGVSRIDTIYVEPTLVDVIGGVGGSGASRRGLASSAGGVARLTEIHVRKNVKGAVEIKDGAFDQSKIKIDVIKEADKDAQLSDITLSHRFYDNGNAVVLVLNIIRSADGNSASNVLTIVGTTTSAGVALIAASIVLWAIEKKCAKLKSSRRSQQSVLASTVAAGSAGDATLAALTERDGQRMAQPPVRSSVPAEIQLTSQIDEQQTIDEGQRTVRQPNRLAQPTEEDDQNISSSSTAASYQLLHPQLQHPKHSHSRYQPAHHPGDHADNSYGVDSPSNPSVAATSPMAFVLSSTTSSASPTSPPSMTQLPSGSAELGLAPSSNELIPLSAATPGSSPRSASSLFRATLLLCTVVAAVGSGVVTASVGNCLPLSVEPRVTVILQMPISVHLDKLKLFFNEQHHNSVLLQEWTHINDTSVHVYDVDEVRPTDRAPCRPEVVCPAAMSSSASAAYRDSSLGDFDLDAGLAPGLDAGSSSPYTAPLTAPATDLMVDCDAGSTSCVCQRGYVMVDGTCVDYDECATSGGADGLRSLCGDGATCENVKGSYTCLCQSGFFRQDDTCRACAEPCPIGFYESVPCSAYYDRVCTPCSKCQKHQYEVLPCQRDRDRLCLHAAHPLLSANNDTLGVAIEGLRVEHSENLFLENLHNTRQLETTNYVTDVKQQTDFFWYRDSKIRINIGLQNVNVVPVYDDVDHGDGGGTETSFMTGSPHSDKDKDRFTEIIQRFCRHPIPDYYTVTLEVTKDRTTRASTEYCAADSCGKQPPDGSGSSTDTCPLGVYGGDRYLRRAVNEPCEKTSAHAQLTPMKTAANSIVCTGDNALLRTLFNMTPSAVQSTAYPSKRCRTATARCEHECLQHDRCQATDIFEQRCCHIDCYVLNDCKLAVSDQCRKAPVECATGDAYRYTLQPVYSDLYHQYSCHLRRRRPDTLYQLWFYIYVPGTNFETPRVQLHFPAATATSGPEPTTGRHQATQFLTIEYSTGVQLDDNVVITGRANEGGVVNPDGGEWNYTLGPAEIPAASNPRFVVNTLAKTDVHVVATRFTRPFAYSTSSWVTGSDVSFGGCNKDVSMFVPAESNEPQWPSGSNETRATQQQQKVVSASIRPSKRPPHEYLIKSPQNSPYMKFIIPANVSVLRWWFQNTSAKLIYDDTFNAELSLVADGRFWEIRIKGRMSECPGYLGLTVNDRGDLEEVFHYDVLVSCPTQFNVTLTVPNWLMLPTTMASSHATTTGSSGGGGSGSGGSNGAEKTFDVTIDDAHSEYRVFLTSLIFGNDVHTVNSTSCSANSFPLNVYVDNQSRQAAADGWRFVYSIAVSVVGSIFLFAGIHSYWDFSKLRRLDHRRCHQYKLSTASTSTENSCAVYSPHLFRQTVDKCFEEKLSVNEKTDGSGCCSGSGDAEKSKSRRRRNAVCALHAILRLIFVVSLTFTVLSTAFELIQRRRLDTAAKLALLPSRRNEAASVAWNRYELHLTAESAVGGGKIRSMQAACDGYIADLAKALVSDFEATAAEVDRLPVAVNADSAGRTKFGTSTTLVDSVFDVFRRRLDRVSDEFRNMMSCRMRPIAVRYRDLLGRLLENPWLTHPSQLFNRTSGWWTTTAAMASSNNRSMRHSSASSGFDDDDSWQRQPNTCSPSKAASFNVSVQTNGFVQFLGLLAADDVQRWSCHVTKHFDQLLQQILSIQPYVEQSLLSVNGADGFHRTASDKTTHQSASKNKPISDEKILQPFCHAARSLGDRSALDRMNSTRFFSTSGSDGVDTDINVRRRWLASMAKNKVRPTVSPTQRGTQWARDTSPPSADAVLRQLLQAEAVAAGQHFFQVSDGDDSELFSTKIDDDIDDDVSYVRDGEATETIVAANDLDDLMAEVGLSLSALRVLVISIDIVLVVFHATRTYAAIRTFYTEDGFRESRSPTIADIASTSQYLPSSVAHACNSQQSSSSAAAAAASTAVAVVRGSVCEYRVNNKNYSTLPSKSSIQRIQGCRANNSPAVLVAASSSTLPRSLGNEKTNSSTALASTVAVASIVVNNHHHHHHLQSGSNAAVGNHNKANAAKSSTPSLLSPSSPSSTMLLPPPSANHVESRSSRSSRQQRQTSNSVWSTERQAAPAAAGSSTTDRNTRRPVSFPPPPPSSSASLLLPPSPRSPTGCTHVQSTSAARRQSDYCSSVFRQFCRLFAHQSVVSTVCLLGGALTCAEFVTRFTLDQMLFDTATVSSNVAGQFRSTAQNSIVWRLLHLGGFIDTATIMSYHANLSNRFLENVDGHRSAELVTWYSRHMRFELANLRGVLALYDEEQAISRRHYTDDLCAIEQLMSSWHDHNDANSRSFKLDICSTASAGQKLNPNVSSTSSSPSSSVTASNRILMIPCNFVPPRSQPFPVCQHIELISSIAVDFFRSIFACIEITVALSDTLLVISSITLFAAVIERCLVRALRLGRFLPTRLVFTVPEAAYHACYSVPAAGSEDVGSELPGGICTSEVPRKPETMLSRDRQQAWCDGGAIIWRDSIPSSNISDGQRSQFSETKV